MEAENHSGISMQNFPKEMVYLVADKCLSTNSSISSVKPDFPGQNMTCGHQ